METELRRLKSLFEKEGAFFLWDIQRIAVELNHIESILLDWDGVFTDGRKDKSRNSTYSELDTMGLNMLRFGYWLLTHRLLPILIVTGEENLTAGFVVERDHFDGVYYGIKNKSTIDQKIESDFNISIAKSIFIFDDILDLSLLRKCAMGFGIGNGSMPLFRELIKKEDKCTYLSANSGSNHGIREISELILGMMGKFEQTVENRTIYSADYQCYLKERNQIKPRIINPES